MKHNAMLSDIAEYDAPDSIARTDAARILRNMRRSKAGRLTTDKRKARCNAYTYQIDGTTWRLTVRHDPAVTA